MNQRHTARGNLALGKLVRVAALADDQAKPPLADRIEDRCLFGLIIELLLSDQLSTMLSVRAADLTASD